MHAGANYVDKTEADDNEIKATGDMSHEDEGDQDQPLLMRANNSCPDKIPDSNKFQGLDLYEQLEKEIRFDMPKPKGAEGDGIDVDDVAGEMKLFTILLKKIESLVAWDTGCFSLSFCFCM